MNPEIAEELLRAAMGQAADQDFPDQLGTLRALAMFKYDSYQQYAPGRQFIESLALWLSQFECADDRQHALHFVSKRLIFVSDLEMRHFVNLMARDRVPSVLQRRLANQLQIPQYRVNQVRKHARYQRALRASLFLGMSDGARIDQFRRNSFELSNEQIAMSYELSPSRIVKMIEELRKDLNDTEAVFEHIFLVDDFAGSGRTILRRKNDDSLDGRLVRFMRDTLPNLTNGIGICPKIFIALYVATEQAINNINGLVASYDDPQWSEADSPQVINVMTITEPFKLIHDRQGVEYELDRKFNDILHNKYDKMIEDEHKGKVLHGYSDCGLPLVLNHNTPNNSVYLIWARKVTKPLFPRFERHQSRMDSDQ